MAHVPVSSARFVSLLSNRNRSVDDIVAAVTCSCDLRILAEQDVEVELADLEVIARFFSRPWPYLLIDDPEPAPGIGRDHRRRRGDIHSLSEELLEALRASDEQLDTIIDLFPDETMDSVDVDISSGTVEDAGAALRAFLDVPINQQMSPHDEFAALRTWIDALDACGIYTAQRKLNDSSVRAFSLLREGHALAVLDTGDSGWARSFSLLHELVHLQMRAAGICDLDERSSTERWCNAVAAAALMPPALLRQADTAALRQAPEVADDALRNLARQFGVSQRALLIRCRDLTLVEGEEYDGLVARWELRRAIAPPRSRGGNYYLNAVNRVGRRYTRHVLRSLNEAQISGHDAAAALGVTPPQIAGLVKYL
jgi:Zn-dependent peptidase ImmA (M78 family)